LTRCLSVPLFSDELFAVRPSGTLLGFSGLHLPFEFCGVSHLPMRCSFELSILRLVPRSRLHHDCGNDDNNGDNDEDDDNGHVDGVPDLRATKTR
jgi:hypothetical protein